MRIVSGKYRSRIIKAPNNDCTRPTADKARQGIFNCLQFYIASSNILDLFAGSGAYGIEALSRNAKFVTFIDNDALAIQAINENLNNLNVEKEKYEIIKDDYKCIENLQKKFDIIFLDPPYKMTIFDTFLDIVEKNKLLNNNGIIVYECDKDLDFINDKYFIKKYKYGIAYVYIFISKSKE